MRGREREMIVEQTECHVTGCSQFHRCLVTKESFGLKDAEVDFCSHPFKPLKTWRGMKCGVFTTEPVWLAEMGEGSGA